MRRVLVALGNYPTIESDARALLERVAEVEVAEGYLTEDDLVARVEGASAVILGAPRLTRRVIFSAKKLEVITRRGIGVDNIDVRAASERGVVVTNCPDVLTPTLVEHAMLLMLGVSRRVTQADRAVRTGRWKEFDLTLTPEVGGKTLGVIGLGSIGVAIAQAARVAFGMRVVTSESPHISRDRVERAGAGVVSLEALLRTSDYVLVSVPLTPETEGMVGAKEIAMMKPSSYLINVARGRIVDEGALYEALRDGKIAGAGLDVLMKQPPDPENPLLKLDNVLLTPHCAGLTLDASRALSFACVDAIARVFRGEMPDGRVRVLNPEAARRLSRPPA